METKDKAFNSSFQDTLRKVCEEILSGAPTFNSSFQDTYPFTCARTLKTFDYFQFLILGYRLVEKGDGEHPYFQFLILGYLLHALPVNFNPFQSFNSSFQDTLFEVFLLTVQLLIFQFLILGYCIPYSQRTGYQRRLSIPHFRILIP